MFNMGYAAGRIELIKTASELSEENMRLKEELDRRDQEAEERTRRSNPYRGIPDPGQTLYKSPFRSTIEP